jgi:hypothetical protein
MLTEELDRIKKEKETKYMEMKQFSAILKFRTQELDAVLKDISVTVSKPFRFRATKT